MAVIQSQGSVDYSPLRSLYKSAYERDQVRLNEERLQFDKDRLDAERKAADIEKGEQVFNESVTDFHKHLKNGDRDAVLKGLQGKFNRAGISVAPDEEDVDLLFNAWEGQKGTLGDVKKGQYNPRDYTSDSYTDFLAAIEAGSSEAEAAKLLKRYTPNTFKDIGGVHHQLNPDTGKWEPLVLKGPNGEDIPVTAELLARQAAEGESIGRSVKAADTFRASFPEAMGMARRMKAEQERLLEKIKKIPTGPGFGKAMTLLSGEYQALEAELNNQALLYIGQLGEQGIKLNPITENELRILFSTGASLGKFKDANVELLENRMAMWDNVIADLEHQMDFAESGEDFLSYRGRDRDAAAEEAPVASAPELSDDDQALINRYLNKPEGG